MVPGTHRGTDLPPREERGGPLPGEVAAIAKAGDAVFINAAIWHTGGRNDSDGLRRGIYLYYGYWWLKRYENERALPWQAIENASEQRERHGDAEIAEEQEAERHQAEDDGRTHGRTPGWPPPTIEGIAWSSSSEGGSG